MSRNNSITVKRGEVYRVPRRTRPAIYIKVVSVRGGQQPKIAYRRVTRAGGKRAIWIVVRHWLQFSNKAWRLPDTWERVEQSRHALPSKKSSKKTRRAA